jgi:PAS domain S-box-containing protein
MQMNPSGISASDSVTQQRSWSTRLVELRYYGLAVLSVAVAVGAALLFESLHFRDAAVPLLLFAVAISSWYGRTGPAVLAVVLSTISFYWYFVEPVRTIYIYPSEIPYFIIFVAFASLISWFAGIRRRAEEALREQADLLNLTHDTIFVVDMEGVIKYWNRGAEERYGWTADQVLGISVHDVLKTVFPAPLEQIKAELIRTGHWEGEILHTKKDGTQAVVATRWTLRRNQQGAPAAILETNNDITERKRAEEALRRSETYLAEAQRLSHTGSWAWDLASDEYVFVSEECLRIFGFDPKQGIPTGEEILRQIHPEDRNRWKENFEKSLRERVDFSDEYRVVLPDGRIKHIHTIRRPVLNDTGGIISLIGTSVDITERKQVEDRLRDTAETLRRSETYLAEAERLNHTGSWADDGNGRPLYWSEEHYRIFGFDPQHGLPSRDQPLERIHPEDLERFLQAFDRVIQQKVDGEVEYRIVLPDGSVKYAHTIGHPVLNADGELVELVGTTVDITERKRAEETLRRSEAYLAEAERLTHTGSFAGDSTTQPLYWSEELYRIFGFDPQQGLPTREQPLERIHPEDLDKFLQAFEKAIHQKVDSEVEYRIVLPDGSLKYAEGIGHPVLNADGEVVEVVGTTVDITERKRAEEALRRADGYLVEAQRLTHTGAWATDAEPNPLYWSEELFRLYGLDSQQGFPTHEQAVQRVHPEDRDRYVQAFHRVIHQKVDSDVEFRTVLPDGTIRYLYGLGHPVLNTNGDVVEVVGTTVDITERKRAEEERARLHQLESDFAHINRVSIMGELTASIAHEVNQPLSGVVSNGSACLRWLAGDTPDIEEARETARRIVRDGKRAAEIIARIRALTKRTAAPRDKLDLNETIREILPLVGDEAKKKSVMIRTCFADDVFPVLGDRVQLQQVVLNLVMNGIEAMSTVDDRTRQLVIASRNIGPDEVEVTVEDSGTGLDPDASARIFDAFYTTKPMGMGMGLSISRSILQAHGGRLWATANQGPGTIFHLTLPKEEEGANAELARV